ncbi:MAG: DegT/DnrJ/EryC1/StrS aminotransferase family protein [Myxococcaceae bacterium]|nr:DegT/DnrJ/EryC1/StrS aminotransferase family protein [Myxococcaceae bacterium]
MDTVIQSLPNLWPSQLLPRPWAEQAFPLNRSDLELTYLGRNAVWRAVRQLGLAGAEVIAPAYHHGVEIAALLAAGARVRFARVDAAMRLDLEHLEAQIGPETRALYVIHYAGFPQPMAPLQELARRRGLLLIEDCALALFSQDGSVPLGSRGDAAIFCFYKTVPVAHGGALLLNAWPKPPPLPKPRPPPLLSTLSHLAGSVLFSLELGLGAPGRAARNAIKSVTRDFRQRANAVDVPVGTQEFDPEAVDLGMSSLTEQVLRAAEAQEIIRRRRANWLFLHQRLGEPGRSPWEELPAGVCPLFYAIRVNDKDQALATLRARGVDAVDFWRFGHPSAELERFPEVDALRRQIVELPCHQDLGTEQLERVVHAAREVITSH